MDDDDDKHSIITKLGTTVPYENVLFLRYV